MITLWDTIPSAESLRRQEAILLYLHSVRLLRKDDFLALMNSNKFWRNLRRS